MVMIIIFSFELSLWINYTKKFISIELSFLE